MQTNKQLPLFLQNPDKRKYILKNHIYLNNRIPEYLTKSIMLKGEKAKGEYWLLLLSKKLKPVGNILFILQATVDTISTPVELSPTRMGKKVKMIPRMSSLFRQVKRTFYVLTAQARTRKFINKNLLTKLYKEIIASIYFYQDSYRQNQNWTTLTTSFFNLRYLNRRWF